MAKKPAAKKPAAKTAAANKPAAKKPAARKRRPNGYASTSMVKAPAAKRRKKRRNPAFSLKAAAMSLLGVAPGAIVGVGGELGLLTARGEAVAGAAMIAVGVGMVGADIMPNLGAAMIGAGSVPVAREVYRMVTADAPAELPAAPVAGIGSDYAARRGDVITGPDGYSRIADGRGGFLAEPANRPVMPANLLQGVALGNA